MSCDHGTDPDAKPEDSGSLPHRDVLGPSLHFWLVSLHYTLWWKPLLPSVDPPGSVGSRVGSAPRSRSGTEEREGLKQEAECSYSQRGTHQGLNGFLETKLMKMASIQFDEVSK